MDHETLLRAQLAKLLDWREAHAGFDKAVDGIPPALQGVVPQGLPYSMWQLVEHLRIAQHDILDFCINSRYEEKTWPDDYWPRDPGPKTPGHWDESLAAYRRDRDRLKQLATDVSVDLFAKIPHGSGQTYVRELLLVADHNAYHVGQIVIVRRCLGIWTA